MSEAVCTLALIRGHACKCSWFHDARSASVHMVQHSAQQKALKCRELRRIWGGRTSLKLFSCLILYYNKRKVKEDRLLKLCIVDHPALEEGERVKDKEKKKDRDNKVAVNMSTLRGTFADSHGDSHCPVAFKRCNRDFVALCMEECLCLGCGSRIFSSESGLSFRCLGLALRVHCWASKNGHSHQRCSVVLLHTQKFNAALSAIQMRNE